MYGSLRMYAVTFAGTVTAAGGDTDLVSLLVPSGRAIVLVEAAFTVTSELAESADESLDVSIQRGNTTVGSGGASATVYPLDEGNGISATTTARTNDTTVASAGTAVEIHRHAPPQRNEWHYQPIPLTFARIETAGIYVCFRMMNALADDVTMRGYVYFGESD